MQTHSLAEIKKSLLLLEPHELTALALRMVKYKKENKELLSYLLFDAPDEAAYTGEIKAETDALFEELRYAGAYKYTKQVRKILRHVHKHIRYSGNPATEAELLIHFCAHLKQAVFGKHPLVVLQNLYARQLLRIDKALGKLHEDLRYDFQKDFEALQPEGRGL